MPGAATRNFSPGRRIAVLDQLAWRPPPGRGKIRGAARSVPAGSPSCRVPRVRNTMSRRLLRAGLPVLFAALGWAAPVPAQAPSPLSQPLPQAPVLAPPVPLGVQRGTSLDLTLTGTNLVEPTALQLSFPAKV